MKKKTIDGQEQPVVMPLYNDAERCLEIRCRSKTGRETTKEEHRLCLKMLHKYPNWYSETERDIFNRTVPFGSNVKI